MFGIDATRITEKYHPLLDSGGFFTEVDRKRQKEAGKGRDTGRQKN